jgi:hypothetical protein
MERAHALAVDLERHRPKLAGTAVPVRRRPSLIDRLHAVANVRSRIGSFDLWRDKCCSDLKPRKSK